ncbi:spermatogenesis-associated protein 16 [Latimeria chalumnae]|uniref:Spermatogenesis-associated protein 16 n=1 Tax=Latimeria chalumnae TaxID=7897 RepID=H3AVB2_LATCH|nr:PREDICTED: spermatogenesis-associated protein 16 [Latimeria chalumnae]|eukprot:XP_006001056.1 PREDICTED: spermatogenesis-associated protein 16 [Latimeria chalumnae]
MDSVKSESSKNSSSENLQDKAVLKPDLSDANRNIFVESVTDNSETTLGIRINPGKKSKGKLRQKVTNTRNVKLKRASLLDSSGVKRKSEIEEKSIAKKEQRTFGLEDQSQNITLPRILLKSVMDVEIKLVYIDEQDITYEFMESQSSTSAQSMCQVVEVGDSLSAPNLSLSPQIDKWCEVALREASSYYRQKKYAVAAGRFRTALELCNKGAVLCEPFTASHGNISCVASFVETKLVACYLRMRRPDLALNHSHRSIILNPVNFRNHLRQAAVFKALERYVEAARSAMIADYMYWLSGGREQHMSKLIKLYWQAMLEEAITRAESFSVMYTPFAAKPRVDRKEKVKEVFKQKHSAHAEYIYTDPEVIHVLPQTADWSSVSPQHYMLTLGFKNKEDGFFLEKIFRRKLPTFTEKKTFFGPVTVEEAAKNLETFGKRILPVLEFIKSTKLAGGFCAGSGVIEKLQYVSYLSLLQRVKEQSQVINQVAAELATIPYLQDINQQDAELLQLLMADAMDTLEVKRSDRERVWNKIEKVGLIEDFIYQLEDNFLKTKELRNARKQRMKMKRPQSAKLHQSLGNIKASQDTSKMAARTLIQSESDSWDNKGLSSN